MRVIRPAALAAAGGAALLAIACSGGGNPPPAGNSTAAGDAGTTPVADAMVPANDGGDASNEGGEAGHDADADAAVSLGDPPPAGRCRLKADCTDPNARCYSQAPACDPLGQACLDDSACAGLGADFICDRKGGCPLVCVKGCSTDAECGTARACNAQHRCESIACTVDGACGSGNNTCNPESGGSFCGPKACKRDADCANHCIFEVGGSTGTCSGDWGVCATGM